MDITLLLDADLDGEAEIIQTGLEETGWDQVLTIAVKRLRDFGLPHHSPDQDIWRFVQQHRFWLLTNNRNSESESSLQATIERENTPQSLPVITIIILVFTMQFRCSRLIRISVHDHQNPQYAEKVRKQLVAWEVKDENGER